VGRVSTFANADIVRMVKNDLIAVAGDDWYQRRKQDAEGEFFRNVADQGPRKGAGGDTRQGIYVFTAGGKLLAYGNHSDAAVMRGFITTALTKFKQLPASERAPGAVKMEQRPKVDPEYARQPPTGGLIVNVHTRIIDKDAKGDFCQGTCEFTGGDRAAHDHLWLTAEDCKALVPANPKKDETAPLPTQVALRLLRFNLVDNTRGEPAAWKRQEVRSYSLLVTVTDVTPKKVILKVHGSALLTTEAEPNKAQRGFDVAVLATLSYDIPSQRIDRFDGVALGLHWGQGTYTPGARWGRTLLGIAFELAKGDSPADQLPPQGARYLKGYLEADRE
jgi:hypothetical protein